MVSTRDSIAEKGRKKENKEGQMGGTEAEVLTEVIKLYCSNLRWEAVAVLTDCTGWAVHTVALAS